MDEKTCFLNEQLIDELFEELNDESMLVSDASCSGSGICGGGYVIDWPSKERPW